MSIARIGTQLVQSSDTSGSATVTVPAGTTYLLLGVSWWSENGPKPTYIKFGFDPMTEIAVANSAPGGAGLTAIYGYITPAEGNVTFTWEWAEALGWRGGANFSFTFLSGVDGTTPVRDTDTCQTGAASGSVTLTSVANDYCYMVAYSYYYEPTTPISGQTEIVHAKTTNNTWISGSEKVASTTSTVLSFDGCAYGCASGCSLIPAANRLPAPTGLTIATADPIGAPTAHVLSWTNSETYDSIKVYTWDPSAPGGAYSLEATLAGSATNYPDTRTVNYRKYYYLVATVSSGDWDNGGASDPSVKVSICHYYDSTTVNLVVETWQTSSLMAPRDYGYFLGSSDGLVSGYSPDYLSDDGASIDAYWQSKSVASFDISESLSSNWLSLYTVQVSYVDLSDNMTMILSASTDGGQTWQSQSQIVGNGDGTTKDAYFYFHSTGSQYDFKIEMPSADKEFQIIRLLTLFAPGSETFQVT